MYNFTLSVRQSALSLLLAVSAIGTSVAQNQIQARSYQTNRTYQTASPELAVDESPATAATVTPPAVGAGAVRVTFPAAVQPGQQAMLVIKASTSLATVLGGMALKTFSTANQNPDQPIQNIRVDDPATVQITVSTTDPDASVVKFTATQAFNQLALEAGALLNTSYSVNVYAVYATVAPLPVELTTFSGKATPAGVALQWATASERNANYFEVQRTENSLDSFRSLGQVKCAGTSSQAHTYQFVDAASAGLHYYRLRQVDADGKESFSPVVAVEGGALATILTAYPTLATHTLTVTGPAGAHLSVFNQQGQQVQVADIAASQTQQLNVGNLPAGMYFLRDAATGQSTRFFKTGGER